MSKGPFLSSTHIYIAIFMVIAIAYAVYFTYTQFIKKRNTEHFVDEEYQARIEVMKVFDLVLNRKPTPEEINTYSEFKNEQDILVQVLKDFKTNSPSTTVQEEEPSSLLALLDKTSTDAITAEETKPAEAKYDMVEVPLSVTVTQKIKQIKEAYTDDDKVCMNKYFIKQILDDLQAKIDSVRVLVS